MEKGVQSYRKSFPDSYLFSGFSGLDTLLDLLDKPKSNLVNYKYLGASDVIDESDKITIQIDLPGFKKEDVEISLDSDYLIIKGSRDRQTKEVKCNYKTSYMERQFGTFEKRYYIGKSCDTNSIEASYIDGVLAVTIPKKEKEKQIQRIEIK